MTDFKSIFQVIYNLYASFPKCTFGERFDAKGM